MLTGLLLGAALATGCGKSAPATETPDAAAADMAYEEGADGEEQAEAESPDGGEDSLVSSLAELEAREDELLEAGVELPEGVQQVRAAAGKESAVPAGAGAAANRCQRVCDLNTAICTLRDQICGLADEHDDDRRYADACERAKLDCERATEACSGCDA